MKIWTKKVSDKLSYTYNLVFPGAAFWGIVSIQCMLSVIIKSIEIERSTIIYAIPIQVASTIFLYQSIIRRRRVLEDDDEE